MVCSVRNSKSPKLALLRIKLESTRNITGNPVNKSFRIMLTRHPTDYNAWFPKSKVLTIYRKANKNFPKNVNLVNSHKLNQIISRTSRTAQSMR
jgi:hypothetical protein